ncbi:hypothetical protein M758_2G093500 [Ceratodon purpureus]|nr:hypothetical protein M758_2G093500 [Ceratodon purpureus]
MAHEEPGTPTFYLYIAIIIGLVLFAGLMSGLTLGLMSLSLVDLEVLQKSGTDADRKHAGKILPVVKRQHLLLCTLLIGNALAMEALPIFLDSLVEAWGAILISVTLILLFGEIIPQAVCSRYGLAVGAAMSPVVRILLVVFFPISYPISKLLDAVLGKRHGSLFRRSELKTLVDFHGDEAGKGGELTHDETTIIAGALELTEKTASQAMTLIEDVFALNVNDKLDMETMRTIMAKGHSRIPVYADEKNNIIGLLLVKNLLTLPPQDETPVRNCTIRKIPRVPESAPLYDILNEFQKGHSHMAVVVKYNKEKTESLHDGRIRQLIRKRSLSLGAASSRGLGSQNIVVIEIPEEVSTDGGGGMDSINRKSAILKLNDEGTRGQLLSQRTAPSKKWVNSVDRDVLEIRDGSLPRYANDEEVVGIITMEDLIEELLQEEILDETDEYVDIHNKIKVKMLPPGGRSPSYSLSDSTPMPSPELGSNLRDIPASPASSAANATPAN